jgi:hypothetical protein
VAGCCECGDEHSGSCAKELVTYSRPIAELITCLARDSRFVSVDVLGTQ